MTKQLILAFQCSILIFAFTSAITMVLDFIPPIDWVMFGIEELAPFIAVIITALVYGCGYVVINMLNGYNENKFCNDGEALTFLPPTQKNMLLVLSFLVICLHQYSEYIMMEVGNDINEVAGEVAEDAKKESKIEMDNGSDGGGDSGGDSGGNGGGDGSGTGNGITHITNHNYNGTSGDNNDRPANEK
jgi:uncharacterized membrane protein YgcG